ncbi:hypothetical protein PspCFBP13506_11605 [Pseudomonas sp. CFBP13506]|uniref:hypothetical protein n=1 Tax=Pseudomonas sp. CFBP13506 TaxID=2184010 RepID=UPI0010BFD997|nr:hypothetical protein [Pseudomonas sp. CFBP13506]TKJ63023.1 hypothetical protein PspCFBP13506_11605 [Pseudomonas sp. CFBP13506]
MSAKEKIHALAFLEEMFPSQKTRFESEWLTSDFDSNIWCFDFARGHRFCVNFNLELEDGSKLSDPKNKKLLKLFKNWITVQNTQNLNQGVKPGSITAYANTRRAINIIDYLLLNSSRLKLASHGLNLLTENDVASFFYQLSSSEKIAEGVYNWRQTVVAFLRKSSECSDQIVLRFAEKNPDLYFLMIQNETAYGLSPSETLKVKIWLHENEYYSPILSSGYRLSVSITRLASHIYKNTLVGGAIKSALPELNLAPYPGMTTEYNVVSVRAANEDSMSDRQFTKYYATFMAINKLPELGIEIPSHAFTKLSLSALKAHLNLAQTMRFKTLRPSILLPALQKAIDFIYEYGDDIFQSASAVIAAQAKYGESVNDPDSDWWVRKAIAPRLAELGVQCWSLSSKMLAGKKLSKELRENKVQEYFKRLRNNEGLWELLRVYYGAAQLIIGLLMARRQSELTGLMPFECLDESKRNLVFFNAKSGFLSNKQALKRPIPSIGVHIIENLENFQSLLLKNKIITEHTYLFAPPDRYAKGLKKSLHSPAYNRSIDFFCDYIEAPRNNEGSRFYFRQHQLRRGFSMIFFWGNSFGGLDTLRWFLGHADLEHLYHYITEATPGEVLRGVKAAYLADSLAAGDKEVSNELAAALLSHFGTSEFTILDSQEVEIYLETLIENHSLTVEPHFIKIDDVTTYRLVTKLKKST